MGVVAKQPWLSQNQSMNRRLEYKSGWVHLSSPLSTLALMGLTKSSDLRPRSSAKPQFIKLYERLKLCGSVMAYLDGHEGS